MVSEIISRRGDVGVRIDGVREICRIVLPGVRTPSLNTYLRLHWSARSRLRRDYWAMLLAAWRKAPGTAASHRPTRHRDVRIERVTQRGTLDQDNFVGGCKALVDGLVDAGLIAGDSPEWAMVEYIQSRGKTATIITVSERDTVPSTAHREGA